MIHLEHEQDCAVFFGWDCDCKLSGRSYEDWDEDHPTRRGKKMRPKQGESGRSVFTIQREIGKRAINTKKPSMDRRVKTSQQRKDDTG